MATTRTATKFDLHKRLMEMARDAIERNCELDDGQRCFNLFTFLEELESDVDSYLSAMDSPCRAFILDPNAVARFLWCCLALESGCHPSSATFRGMPVLD